MVFWTSWCWKLPVICCGAGFIGACCNTSVKMNLIFKYLRVVLSQTNSFHRRKQFLWRWGKSNKASRNESIYHSRLDLLCRLYWTGIPWNGPGKGVPKKKMTSYDHRGCDGWTLAFEDLKFSVPSRSCQHKLGAAGIATQEILQLAQVVISCGVENSDAIWQDAEWMIEIKTDILWVQ